MAFYQVTVMLESNESPRMYRSGERVPTKDNEFFEKAISFRICLSFSDETKKGCYPLMICRVGEKGFAAVKDVPDVSFREQANFKGFLELVCNTLDKAEASAELNRAIQFVINSQIAKAEKMPQRRLAYII